MNTQVTRPGHLVPGWPKGVEAWADLAPAPVDSEAQASRRMLRWGVGLLLASLFSGLVWAFMLSAAFDAASALHVIPAAQAVGHVL